LKESGVELKPHVLLVGGTGASQFLCNLYYFLFCRILGGAKPIAISGLGRRSVWKNYAELEKRINALGLDPERPLILVGHSQGGILALLYAIHHPGRVAKVITICSPLRGTTVHVPGLRGALSDMQVGSPFMVGDDVHHGFIELTDWWAEEWGDDLPYVLCCVVAHNDELVRPYTNAFVPGATIIHMKGGWEHITAIGNAFIWVPLLRFMADVPGANLTPLPSRVLPAEVYRSEVTSELDRPRQAA
jgi:pimeloyl-ACP methyl ester carboxylesterase